MVQQKVVRRGVALPLGQKRRPVLFRQPVRVLLPRLGVRQMVEHPRQQGPGLGQVALHPAQAVHDAVLPVQQEQVRPAAHHLQDQTAADLVAHLVRGLDDQLRQAFRRGLAQFQNFAAGEIFPEQHTKHRRLGRVLPGQGRQLDPGPAGVGREQQAAGAVLAPDVQQNLIPAGLVDLINAPAEYIPFRLCQHGGETQSVHGHPSDLPFHHRF